MSLRYQILSFDGGGLKGIFTTSFLAKIEDITGKRITDCFDLIAGTSTGGIIALALALGYKPAEILQFYKEKGPSIFPAQGRCGRVLAKLRQVFRPKYSQEPLRKVLIEYFGDKRLCDCTKRLIIPAYDSVRADVYVYKAPYHKHLRTDFKEYVRDIALATASAPTYLPGTVTDAGIHLIDGGVWANNPSMVALTDGLGYLAWAQESIAMLSIGTTHSPITSSAKHIQGGLLTWSDKIIDFLMDGQSRAAENQCLHILGPDRFLRVNPVVARKYSLDEMASELEGIGQTEARNQVNEINKRFLQHQAAEFVPLYTINDLPGDVEKSGRISG
jgi:patatin-like phospholipase/acyl hydrolase